MKRATLKMRSAGLLALLACGGVAGAADDPCQQFKWDLTRERVLFMAPAGTSVQANASPPPIINLDTAVDLVLAPQATVSFVAPPSKPMLTDGAWAGLASFRVDRPGIYRIALDAPFWIDVLADRKALLSVDFGGPGGNCPPPTKIVTYDLPAGPLLTLQLSGATDRRARVTITRVP